MSAEVLHQVRQTQNDEHVTILIRYVSCYRLSLCLVAARVSINSQLISVAITVGDAGQAEAIFGMVRLFIGAHKVCTYKFI